MEPAAPGTEDDIKPTLPSTLTKKENEQERLLSITAILSNGKAGNVFELSFHNGSEHWYCNLCECPIMGRVYHHEIGKRHTNNMQVSGHPIAVEPEPEPEPTMQIAPGEPIPPGFENEMGKIAQIQERLDGFTVGPLIGLEYLFELTEYDRDKEPSYLCLLCDKRGDPRTVIAHLASYNHITQYTQRHFITCFRALSPYITKQYKRNWQATMQKIAEAIEQKFGRLKPHVVDRETFDAKRTHYQNLVASGPHFNERSGVTFEELVNKEQLTKTIDDDVTIMKLSEDVAKRAYRRTGTEPGSEDRKSKRSPSPPVVAKPKKPKTIPISGEKRRSLSSVSSISSSDLSEFDPSEHPLPKREKAFEKKQKPSLNKSPVYKKRRSRSRSPHKRYGRRSRSRSVSPYKGYGDKSRGRGLHPWQRSDYIRSRTDTSADRNKQKNDKLDEFKRLSTAIENDMERILKQHEKNPEKHPQYNEEWKKFWNRRYKELQAEGKDGSTYDFKPEWIEFWNKRMSELHGLEVKGKKEALRKRLGLPEEPTPISFKIAGKRKPGQKEDSKDPSKPAPMASTPDQDPDVIVIEDKDEDTISSKRSHSPWESEPGSRPTSRRSREKSRDRSRSRERSHFSRDRSKERSRRSRDRSRSRSRDRGWRGRSREREYRREYSREKPYYREPYRKSDLPEYMKPPRVLRDVTRHPVMSPPEVRHVIPEPEPEPVDDGEVNIVGVLRLLTALEEKLGSLGPKVIDLLGQALALEKNEANSSEVLLDNEVNCVLFETVKEKLKGQLLAELVGYNQEKAFKNAIKKIASLIHFAGERKKQKEKEKPRVDPIKVPGVGTVDKNAIAKQIATALVLQGKTDVSQGELEQLINAVVGMAEASRNSDKPMTTASFLQQLSQPKPPENKAEPPIGSLTSVLQSSNAETASTTNTSSMEGLSDSDLQTLLQNFKDLCTDEQHSLISYLKKLEAREPERVERLRKFVNLDANPANGAGGGSGASAIASNGSRNEEKPVEKAQSETSGRSSPFSSRMAGVNPTVEENSEKEKVLDETTHKTEKPFIKVMDSDDEDYSFEDVFKVAKQNVKEKEEKDKEKEEKEKEQKDKERKAKTSMFKTEDFDLSNAKSLIANIMGQFKAKNSEPSTSASNLLGLNISSSQKLENPFPGLPPNLENFPINLANLTEALNTAQKANSDLSATRNLTNLTNSLGAGQRAKPDLNTIQNLMNPAIPGTRTAQPNMPHGAQFGMKPQNVPHSGQGNFLPPVAYPQQNPYAIPNQQFGAPNNFDRPNFDQNRFPHFAGNNRDVHPNQPPFDGRPRPGQFDGYSNRW